MNGKSGTKIKITPKKALLSRKYQEIDREFLALGSKPSRIALVFNPVGGSSSIGEISKTDQKFIYEESRALKSLGHEVIPVPVSFQNLKLIKELKVDFAFNLCEGTGLDGDPGVEVILNLEQQVIPFSGMGSAPYHLTNDKLAMKRRLAQAGVPVLMGFSMAAPDAPVVQDLEFPLFVKPRYGFGSQGIDARSCAINEKACRKAVERVVRNTGIDALVEEFIDGREITVGVIGSGSRVIVMPPLEVRFGKAYAGQPKVRMYDTKNNTDSPLYWGFKTACPAPVEPKILQRIEETALRAYLAIGGDGYSRVDIRLSKDGTPYVLEVNGNCSLEYSTNEHDSGIFPLIGRALGWSYPDVLARLIGAGRLRALRRYRLPMMALRSELGEIRPHSTLNIRKGALVCPFETSDPELRFLSHSEQPNLIFQYSRGKLWLAAARSIKPYEALTVNRQLPARIPVLGAAKEAEFASLQAKQSKP